MKESAKSVTRHIELDFVRGIAILLVLLFHYQDHQKLISGAWFEPIESMGWTGVDLFFVLSGFLVGGLMMKEWRKTGGLHTGRFLKRRAFKIWPAYYFFILAAVIFHTHPLNTFLWQNLLNVQNYSETSLGHTWSLAVEEHFYLALAALMGVFASGRVRPRNVIFCCVVLAVLIEVYRAYLVSHKQPFFYQSHTRIDAMLIGVALAALSVFFPLAFERLQEQRLLLAMIVLVVAWRLYADHEQLTFPPGMSSPWLITLVDYAAAALLLLLYRPGGTHTMIYRAVARIGVYSYGIYLWHVAVLHPVDWVASRAPVVLTPVILTLLPYVSAIALGVCASKAIEFPFLRLRERMVPSTVPEPAIPAA